MLSPIDALVSHLRRTASTSSVSNPYRSRERAANLRTYLEALCALPHSGHLLVGEAPGHRGCALTGIPFTSERVLASCRHPFIRALFPSLRLSGAAAEPTATIVWDHLSRCAMVPAMWNVFPFHPHQPGDQRTNRRPTASEVAQGRRSLELILEIVRPRTVVAVGETSGDALGWMFPALRVERVRHPSHGGKAAFLIGIEAAGLARRSP